MCPSCGHALVVAVDAPPRVSCPRCLAEVANPAWSPDVVPVPVLPLDTQVARDTNSVAVITAVLLAALGAAAFVTNWVGDARGFQFVLVLAVGVTVCAFILGAFRRAPRPLAETRPELAASGQSVAAPPRHGGPMVLGYGMPQSRRAGASTGAVLAGFFGAIGVCALGIFVLGGTVSMGGSGREQRNYNALVLAGVVLMVIAFIVFTVRLSARWRGFGPGAIAGLILGMMALGPCAACYLMTLQ
jgi:hypothetical protein